jgi:hypothetical protein
MPNNHARPLAGAFLLLTAALAACQGTSPTGSRTPTNDASVPPTAAPAKPSATVASSPVAPALGEGIVFERARTADVNELVWTDGVTERVIQAESSDAVLAPDGRRFIDTTPTVTGVGASLIPFDGGDPISIPNPGGLELDGAAAWSPDGLRVVSYSWSEADPSTNGLYGRDADGGGDVVRLTTAGDLLEHPLAYSPDGTLLLFSHRLEPGAKHGAPQDLYVVPVAGGTPTRLNPAGTSVGLFWSIKPASWSPDGTQIVFAAHSDDPDLAGVWIVDADGTSPHRIAPIETTQYTYAHWSPDGAWISTAPALTLELVRPDGSDRHAIAGVEGREQWFGGIWSTDGSQLLSMRYSGMVLAHADLWVVGVDGSGAAAVTHRAGTYVDFGWVPG